MTTLTPRLGLKKHTTADKFKIQDYTDNWLALDGAPGVHICTSSTNPSTWNINQAGRLFLETDTGLLWRWNGTQAVRVGPSGHLQTVASTTDVSTSSTSLVVALTNSITVPKGGRSIQVAVSGTGVYSTVNLTRLAVQRGGSTIKTWLQHGKLTGTADAQPTPLDRTFIDVAPVQGIQTYTLMFSAEIGYPGTSTLQASLSSPLTLSLTEV